MSKIAKSHPFATGETVRRWAGGFALAAGMGVAYFLAARLSLGLLMRPEGVAVFWLPAGITSGVLIALGPRARWPVAVGAVAGDVVPSLLNGWAAVAAVGLCNAAEALIAAGLIQYYFGKSFTLSRLRDVLGLQVAAVVATVISGIGAAVAYRLSATPSTPMLTIWLHWVPSDALGIMLLAPLIIGIAAAVREPPPRRELLEGGAALALLLMMTGIIISLPPEPWETVVPGALVFPMLLWLAARCRPVFAAAGAFMVSFAIVWTMIFGIGHFGDLRLSAAARILQAQAIIMVVTLGSFVLAALFAERRENEERLARANTMLEREREKKLLNIDVVIAAIAHQLKQPLTAISFNIGAASQFLRQAPPDLDEVQKILATTERASHWASDVFDSIHSLFRRLPQHREPIDLNKIALDALQSLRRELRDHGVTVRTELASALPVVNADTRQLQQVFLILATNAIEAMDAVKYQPRTLRLRSERSSSREIAFAVQDTGPGIDPEQIERIFDVFVTTKAGGMGLGLAICRMVIEGHGGKLTASSDGKSGAIFRFVLPIEAAG
ncbi:MAG TPA: MASE1 domain-containing protein [Xanthobacteraceae bacterium]|jgi:signal transduction histidine kinase